VGTKNTLNFYMGKTLYLLNEKGLFELRLKEQIEATLVRGYNEPTLPKRVRWYDNRLLTVRIDGVTIYKFTATD